MIVGVARETFPGTLRVALVPLVVPSLLKAGFHCWWKRAPTLTPGIATLTTLKRAPGLPHRERNCFAMRM